MQAGVHTLQPYYSDVCKCAHAAALSNVCVVTDQRTLALVFCSCRCATRGTSSARKRVPFRWWVGCLQAGVRKLQRHSSVCKSVYTRCNTLRRVCCSASTPAHTCVGMLQHTSSRARAHARVTGSCARHQLTLAAACASVRARACRQLVGLAPAPRASYGARRQASSRMFGRLWFMLGAGPDPCGQCVRAGFLSTWFMYCRYISAIVYVHVTCITMSNSLVHVAHADDGQLHVVWQPLPSQRAAHCPPTDDLAWLRR